MGSQDINQKVITSDIGSVKPTIFNLLVYKITMVFKVKGSTSCKKNSMEAHI